MIRLAGLTLVAALGTACASTATGAGPEPVVVARPLTAPSGAPPDPAARSFRENLLRANEEADRAGWLVKQTLEVPGHRVAVVIYDPKPERAPAYKVARVQVVGAGAYEVVSAESGMIDVIETRSRSMLWHLRGDALPSLVLHLTPCGAYCGVAKPLVVDVVDDQPKVQPNAPACPTCIHDENGDGVPEFDVRLAKLDVAPCSRVSCGPAGALMVEVRGLEVWDGSRYATDLSELRPLYASRLEQARKDAEHARRRPGKGRICPLNALQVAARLYAYSRLGGESRDDALGRADAVMKGYDFRPCKKEYDLLGEPKRWTELREALGSVELPRLERSPSR